MTTNGPKSSQDPRFNANDPTKPYSNDPSKNYGNESSHNDPTKPYSNEPISTPSEPKTGYTDSMNKGKNSIEDHNPSKTEQWGEKIKSQTEHVGDKIKDTFKQFKDSKQVDDLYNYATSNKEKTITYILLALGLIILLFMNEILGGLIIGLLAGYYYSREIVFFIRNLPQFLEGQDQIRYVVAAVLLIGLLFEAPGIILGTAIVAAFKQIINKNDSTLPSKESDITPMNKTNNGNNSNNGNSKNKDKKF